MIDINIQNEGNYGYQENYPQDNYKNSKNFVKAVKSARKYEKT